MNLVGKIFVVVIFIMSLVFMAFSMAVYATHKNWKEEIERPGGLKAQLTQVQADLEKSRNEYGSLKKDYETERAAKVQAVAKLESELKLLRDEQKKREQEYADLVKAERQAVAAMKTTQENMSHSEKVRDTVATEVSQAQQDRDAHFKEVRRLTDLLHQADNDKEQLQKRLTTLAADLALAKEALRYFDIDEKANFKAKQPPNVEGVVLASAGAGMVEISIGSDQGLRVGHQLQVYRTSGGSNVYVGRIQVVKTTPNRAVCKIDPKLQNSNVMRGDRVVSKIE